MSAFRLKKPFNILAGVVAIVIMSVSFSGYSITIGSVSDFVCRIFENNNPVVCKCNMLIENANTMDMVCDYIYDEFSPLGNVLSESANDYRGDISIGEISSRVGENSYILYEQIVSENDEVTGDIDIVYGERYSEAENGAANAGAEAEDGTGADSRQTMSQGIADNAAILSKLRLNLDTKFLLKNFYVVDSTTSVKKSDFNVKEMLDKNFTIQKSKSPQILIYHTHAASEAFRGSTQGVLEEGIVGVGDYLEKVLTETYGYSVYHDRTAYDIVNGKIDRSLAYAKALPSIKNILSSNPSIEVVIDLHRDGVGAQTETVTTIDGKATAQIMFFNGLSRNSKGPIKYLKNDNLADNLAFSLQMKIKAMELYPGFTKPIYLKGYRYNLHLLSKCLLIELGSQKNTFEEACNAVPPFAAVLNEVLAGSTQTK